MINGSLVNEREGLKSAMRVREKGVNLGYMGQTQVGCDGAS